MSTIQLQLQHGANGQLVYGQANNSRALVSTGLAVNPNKAIDLRPYQHDCLDGVRSYFRLKDLQTGKRTHTRVILCAPTGAGKTVMFSYMTQKTLNDSLDAKVLILTNRVELLTQAGGTLEKFGIRYEAITADNKKINHRARCYVGMVETYANRIEQMPWLLDMTLVIIDECHYGNFKKLFSKFKPSTFIIGATATPIAAAKDDPLSNYYQALVNKIQIADLIDLGFLSPCIIYVAKHKIDRSKLKKDNKGEYSEKSQYDQFADRMVYDGLLERYQEICNNHNGGKPIKTICFNVNVEHSQQINDLFNAAGIPARHVDGTTSKTKNKKDPAAESLREKTINDFKKGLYPVINNVGILNAGFDDPDVCLIIMNRATTSVSLWLQSCGRGSRIAPGKKQFIVLDMGDNWIELDPWDAERDWEELWKQTKRKSDKVGVAPMKDCGCCGRLVPLSLRICTECGYEFPVKEKKLAEATEFVQLTPEMTGPKLTDEQKEILKLNRPKTLPTLSIDVLLQIQDLKKYKPGWIIYLINDRAESEEHFYEQLREVARIRKYHPAWVNRHQWKPKPEPELQPA